MYYTFTMHPLETLRRYYTEPGVAKMRGGALATPLSPQRGDLALPQIGTGIEMF